MADAAPEIHEPTAASAPLRPGIGCDEEEAIRYVGCSRSMFEKLRAEGVILTLRKNWYSYRLLDLAVRYLEEQALKEARVVLLFPETAEDEDDDESEKPKKRTKKELPSVPTVEILARLSRDAKTS